MLNMRNLALVSLIISMVFTLSVFGSEFSAAKDDANLSGRNIDTTSDSNPYSILEKLSFMRISGISFTGDSIFAPSEADQTRICYFGMRGKLSFMETCEIGEPIANCGEDTCEICTANAKGECTGKEGPYALYFVKKANDQEACPARFPNG